MLIISWIFWDPKRCLGNLNHIECSLKKIIVSDDFFLGVVTKIKCCSPKQIIDWAMVYIENKVAI